MNTNCEACGKEMWLVITMGNKALLANSEGTIDAGLLACSNEECMWHGVVVAKKIIEK